MRSPLSSAESLLKKGLDELSLEYSPGQVGAFMSYLAELKKWNRAYNLTSLRTDEEIIVKHFLDSLLYLKAIPGGNVSVMDVGSGAGFPGIPIKIMRPEIMMYLLEPSRKKASFLLHMIKTLGLDGAEVIEKRIEEVGSLTVDIAVTRALFRVRDFYRKASSHVGKGGLLILSKGPRVTEEIKETRDIDLDVLALTLPVAKIKRFVVVIKQPCSAANAREDRSGHSHGGPAGYRRGERERRPGLSHDLPGKTDCINIECRLRRAGCRGFEGCPGYKARA